MFHPQPVHLARELVAELLEEILSKQLFLQREHGKEAVQRSRETA
jgi:hypothetical protein